MWKICKVLVYIFITFLALLCLFFALSIGYISAIVFIPAWFPTNGNRFSRTWDMDDSLGLYDPSVKISQWGLPYDSECGVIRMIFLEMDCLEPARKCQEKIKVFEEELNEGSDRNVQEETFHNITAYCFEAASCMRMMACKEGDYHFNKFHKYPHSFFMNHSSFPNCMVKFYEAIREDSFNNCTMEFQFLSKDPFVKNHAYFHGKLCFLAFVHQFCEEEIFDYLENSYDYFLELAMIPAVDECGIYEKFEALECQNSMDLFKKSTETLKQSNQTEEDYKKVAAVCDEMQNCFQNLTNTCAIPSSFLTKFKEYCEKMHFLSSPFWQCLQRLKTENVQPNLLEYPCFIGHQFSDDSNACLRFRDSADCAKKIMIDLCGFESVERFEESRSYLLEMWDC